MIRPTPPTGHGGESRGFAANMPPLRHRELRWRDAAAGSKLSVEDKQQFEASGFQAKRGQATKDQAHMLNRILAHAGKTLASFIAPALDRQTARGERMWCPVSLRWLRRERAVTERQEQRWVPEIPDEHFMKDWAQIPLLLVTLDQACTGWGACHFLCSPGRPGQPQLQQAWRPHTAPGRLGQPQLQQANTQGSSHASAVRGGQPRPCRKIVLSRVPGGMNLLMYFLGDPFHRSWNDWKLMVKRARGNVYSSVVQMTAVYNHNYQPYLSGANLAKKGEFL